MNQPGFAIHADVCLHPETPRFGCLFARLFHIGITGFVFVLGGAGALMMLASTIVPRDTFQPIFLRDATLTRGKSSSFRL